MSGGAAVAGALKIVRRFGTIVVGSIIVSQKGMAGCLYR